MNIMMLSSTWEATNGVVTSIVTFRRGLVAAGHMVQVLAPGPVSKVTTLPDGTILVPGRRLITPDSKDYFVWEMPLAELTKLAASFRPQVIHTHHLFQTLLLGTALARRLGVPIVAHYHTLLDGYTHYWRLGKFRIPHVIAEGIGRLVTRFQLNRVDHVVTPSEPIAHLLKGLGVRTPIAVIPTGVDCRLYRKPAGLEALRALGIDPKRPVILGVGRLAKEKNWYVLLEAMCQIHEVQPDVQLVLVGPGPEMETISRWVAAHHLEQAVIITGGLTPAATQPLFAAADIFALASVTETQGIVVVEAMAAGIPVVAANKNGPATIVRHGTTGYLVPARPTAFVHALTKLLGDHELSKRFGQAGQNLVGEEYTVAATSFRLAETYRHLVRAS